jgi:ATP adenylyltransferase
MKVLWAPWRMVYVGGAAAAPSGCLFCPGQGTDRRAGLILWEGPQALVMLNKYPYASGHLLVAPRAHVAQPTALPAADFAALCEVLQRAVRLVQEVYRPEGMNLGMNLGRSGGAGIDGHIHWHVVPRWNGDTNFMSVVGDVRVMPEHLEQTYERLQARRDLLEGSAAGR